MLCWFAGDHNTQLEVLPQASLQNQSVHKKIH